MSYDRHVVITGASGGLGRALAEQFARPGTLLSLTGRNPERLQATAASCEARGGAVDTAPLDVTDAAALHDWITARDAAAPVDILVANAGMGGATVESGPTGEAVGVAAEVFAVNMLGVLNSVSPLLQPMVRRGRGQIVLIGSLAGYIGLPQSPAYSASKAAVRIYGDGLRRLLAARGIAVTSVAPGFVDTAMSRSLHMRLPWCWSPERAARHIVAGVARRRREIIFPLPLRLVIGLQRVLPLPLVDWILSRSVARQLVRIAEAAEEADPT